MTDVYSPLLGAALAFAVGTLVCWISGRVSRRGDLHRLVRVGAALTLVALGVAVASHLAIGHTPGSERALGPVAFVVEHPLVAAVALAALALLVLSGREPHA